jgi:hypothetical protein
MQGRLAAVPRHLPSSQLKLVLTAHPKYVELATRSQPPTLKKPSGTAPDARQHRGCSYFVTLSLGSIDRTLRLDAAPDTNRQFSQ